MKKSVFNIIAVIICTAVFISCVGGCSVSEKDKNNKEHSFSDMKTDGELAYNSKGEFSVNLSVDNISLSDKTGINDVKVFYSVINSDKLTDIDASDAVKLNDSEYKAVYAKVSAVTLNSEHSATVSFNDSSFSQNKPDCFFIVFDKNTNETGRYLVSMIPVRYPAYSAVSDTTQIRSESSTNRFKLTLDKSSFANGINADDIVLSGGFEGCKVSEIERTGDNTLSLVISTDSGYKSGENGCITIKRSAITDAAVDVSATVSIVSPSVVFSSTDFEASTNYARITVSLVDCSFSDSVSVAMFGCDNSNVEITRFDRVSASEGVLYLSFDTDTPAKAIELISGCTFTIKDTALSINYPLYFNVDPENPDVSATITEVKENGSDFSVTAQLGVVDGSFNVISKNSFIFSGDYSKAVITSITAQDNSATVCFDIPRTSSVGNAELYGTVGLKSGAVVSRWGTQTGISSFPLYYSYSESNNSKIVIPDAQKLNKLCEALSEYTGFTGVSGNASLEDLAGYKIGDANFGQIFFEQCEKYNGVYGLINKTDKLVKSDRISAGTQNVEYVFAVERYMNDIKALHSLIKPVSDSLARLFAVYESMNSTKDKQELEALSSEADELIGKITSVYSTKIKGISYSEMLDRVTKEYCGGALTAFDSICDDIYNWYPQSVNDKKMFRAMSQSVIVNAAAIQFISVAGSEDKSGAYASLSDDISKLYRYTDSNQVEEINNGDGVLCTTLDRTFRLQKVNSALHNAVNEISLSEISQLENMLEKDSTLESELTKVGFDVSPVRYIVCSDSDITSRSQAEQGRRAYSFVRRATLYDLTSSQTVSEKEYCNYYYSIEIGEDGTPVAVPYVNVYYRLYTLK